MKRLCCALLLWLLLAGTALAVEPADPEQAAQELAALGLLLGDGQGNFDLDSPCNRLHGAVLFTRLLGQEQEATAMIRPHPFKDIDQNSWAAPYVAYLYNQGWAYGQARDVFGTGPMLPNHFATFCLRSLGYSEGSAESDFMWYEALNFMVEKKIISGTLRNRLHNTAIFTRGDAVLLAHATVTAQREANPEQAGFRLIYPEGLLSGEILATIAGENNFTLGYTSYKPTPEAEEELYSRLREPDNLYDVCIIPGYLVERLRADGLLRSFIGREFGLPGAVVSALRDNPYWYDAKTSDYYAVPLAYEAPCLYYDSSRVENPDWGWLFREAYRGGVYLPSDTSQLMPLALHYYNLPYDTADESKLSGPIELLRTANANVAAYMNAHMLDIPEREGAVFGVLPSSSLPQLEKRRQENSAYENWRAILPAAGGPVTVYYAVLPLSGNKQAAAAILRGLMEPENSAANGQFGGYLPAISGAAPYLEGAVAEAYPAAGRERCRPVNLDGGSRAFFEQGMRNALLLEAEATPQPELIALEIAFSRQGEVYQSFQLDLTAAKPELLAKKFQKEVTALGLSLWQEYYDGPDTGVAWAMTMTFGDGSEKNSGGHGLPLLWEDFTGALLRLSGDMALPSRI